MAVNNSLERTDESTMLDRPLRILVVHRYFWPDTAPVASILRSICNRWTKSGHEVSAFTSQPCYKPEVEIAKQPWEENIDCVSVRRCWLPFHRSRNPLCRVICFLLFLVFASIHIVVRRKKYDIVMALTFPPVVSGAVLSRVARLRGSKFFYHCMDIHPESSIYTDKLKEGSLFARLSRFFDRKTGLLANRVIVLSKDMQQTFLSRYSPEIAAQQKSKIRIISNFNPASFKTGEAVMPPEYDKKSDNFRLVFAGNIGQFQALGNLVETAKLLTDYPDIEFVFLGEGAAKKGLVEQAGELNDRTVRFIPHQPVEVADKIMQSADLCIVSLSPGIHRVAHPCKTSSYLAMGCPILMVVEEDSEMFRMTVENDLGYACRGEDPHALKATILRAYENREQIESMRIPAKDYAENHLVQDALLVHWEKLIDEFSSWKPTATVAGTINATCEANKKTA